MKKHFNSHLQMNQKIVFPKMYCLPICRKQYFNTIRNCVERKFLSYVTVFHSNRFDAMPVVCISIIFPPFSSSINIFTRLEFLLLEIYSFKYSSLSSFSTNGQWFTEVTNSGKDRYQINKNDNFFESILPDYTIYSGLWIAKVCTLIIIIIITGRVLIEEFKKDYNVIVKA